MKELVSELCPCCNKEAEILVDVDAGELCGKCNHCGEIIRACSVCPQDVDCCECPY